MTDSGKCHGEILSSVCNKSASRTGHCLHRVVREGLGRLCITVTFEDTVSEQETNIYFSILTSKLK